MTDVTVLWRRLDSPGHEACRLLSRDSGWQLSGTAVFAHEGQPCQLRYLILCDAGWHTAATTVTGWVGAAAVEIELTAHPDRTWRLNGRACPAVAGCIDVDLGFSPSTNMLPIRRLALAVGQEAAVRAAWLGFPGLTLAPLEQRYRRIGGGVYRYESAGGKFVTQLDVNAAGLITRYPDFWQIEAGS